MCYEFIFIFGIISFSEIWANIFTREEHIIELINLYKYLYIITIPVDGTQVLLAKFLEVVEMRSFVTKTGMINYSLIGIPLMLILGDIFNLKTGGIWLAIGIANTMNLVCYVIKIRNLNFDELYILYC